MSRYRVKIHSDLVQVDPLVGGGLATIEQHERAAVVRPFGDLADRERAAVQVGGVEEAHEPDPASELLLEGVAVERSVVGEGKGREPDSPLRREALPHDQVRIVFAVSDQYPVASPV